MLELKDIPKLKIDIYKNESSYQLSHIFENKVLDLEVRLANGMFLQRGEVWTLHQKQQLIMSILKKITIPPLTVVTNVSTNRWEVLDGKQRLITIHGFMNDIFPIVLGGKEYYWSDMSVSVQNIIAYTWIRVNVVYEELSADRKSNRRFTDSELVWMFEFINFTSTPQDEEHLNLLKRKIGRV